MSKNLSPQYSGSAKRSSLEGVRGIVSCVICQAAYAPSQSYDHLLQASPIALESALMSISHFCFRCRRPACPQCWDEIHGVCGDCAQEAHLPFRTPPVPLHGAMFPSTTQEQHERVTTSSPLLCIRHGRFHRSTRSIQRPARPATIPPSMPAPPPSSQQTLPPRPPGRRTRVLPPPAYHEDNDIETQPTRRDDVIEMDTRPVQQRSPRKRIERTLTVAASLLLLLLVAIIVLALTLPGANAFFLSTLHVDIRAEISYLLQLIAHLH